MNCNKCGKEFTEYSDYLYVVKDWGFYSKKDLEKHVFRLCEKCYDNMVKSFVKPVDIKEYSPK